MQKWFPVPSYYPLIFGFDVVQPAADLAEMEDQICRHHDVMILYGYVISIAEYEFCDIGKSCGPVSEVFHKVEWFCFDYKCTRMCYVGFKLVFKLWLIKGSIEMKWGALIGC